MGGCALCFDLQLAASLYQVCVVQSPHGASLLRVAIVPTQQIYTSVDRTESTRYRAWPLYDTATAAATAAAAAAATTSARTGAGAIASGTASAATAGRSRSQEHSRAEAKGGHAEGASLAGHAICKFELLSRGCSSGHRGVCSAQGEQSGGMCTWWRRWAGRRKAATSRRRQQ
jgi:hypothetical protein